MRNSKKALEIIAAIIAFLVLVMMIWDHFTFRASINKMAEQNAIARESVEKMAEQNKLSEKSISRMDSSLALMHESNRLQSQSIALEIARSEVLRAEITEKTKPKLYIKPLTAEDIRGDTSKYEIWVTVENKGLSAADSVECQAFIRGEGDPTVDSVRYFRNNLQVGDGQVSRVQLSRDLGTFCISIVVHYYWNFPGLGIKPFLTKKSYKVYFDSDKKEYTKVRLLEERFLNEECENLQPE